MTEKEVRRMLHEHAVKSVEVITTAENIYLVLINHKPIKLVRGDVRTFARLDTAAGFLKRLGVYIYTTHLIPRVDA